MKINMIEAEYNQLKFCEHCNLEFSAEALKCENCKAGIDLKPFNIDTKPDMETAEVSISETTLHAECFVQQSFKSEFEAESYEGNNIPANGSKKILSKMIQEQAKKPLIRKDAGDAVEVMLYNCDKCEKSFKRQSLLRAHAKRIHTNSDGEDENSVNDKRKKLELLNKREYIKKYQAAILSSDDSDKESNGFDEDSELALIDVESSIPTDLNTLYEALTKLKTTPIGESVYKCRMCKKITFELRDHLKHIITHTGQNCNTCMLCEDVFLGANSLDEHMLRVHNNNGGDEYLPCGIIKCKECEECFLSASEFKRHKRWHAGKQLLHNCDICQVGFSTNAMLEKHKRIIHKASENLPKRFKCFLCKEGFAFQILLTNHKRSHPEFFELIERTTIIKRYNDSNKILYACRTCGKSTHTQTNHWDHLRIHSPEQRQMYKCTLCPKQFTAHSTLKAHLRLHTNDRQYKCEICAISYRHSKTLRNHLIKHTGQLPVICKYCDKSFRDQNQRTEHVRRVHTGETPYQCDLCGEWFTLATLLRTHKLHKHNVDTRQKRSVDIIPINSNPRNKS